MRAGPFFTRNGFTRNGFTRNDFTRQGFTRKVILGVSCGLVVAGLAAGGCGSTVDSGVGADAGRDAVVRDVAAPPADTGPDVVDTGVMACAVDADLSMVNLPDASLADGASSIGRCSACVQTTCKMQFAACNDNCDCKSAVLDFFTCYSAGGSITKCGLPLGTLGGDARTLGQGLIVCIDPAFAGGPGPGCKDDCAVNALFPDAGKSDADAATDATDAPADG